MQFEELFRKVAHDHKMPWRLLAEIAWRESRYDAHAKGAAGEQGLMQIMPSTWGEWAPRVGVSDPLDPVANVTVAAAYLDWLQEQMVAAGHGERYWALAAYNWGIGHVLELLNRGGTWQDVPEVCRDYATGILLRAEAGAVAEKL